MGVPQENVMTPVLKVTHDQRFEKYRGPAKHLSFIRDALAGLIVTLVAIPLGIGFAIASGLKPEQGIMASAVAGILGGLFGGSKYQVYGPTAAFIPLLASIVSRHGVSFLALASLFAGLLIMVMGVLKLGDHFAKIPFSVTVGFTIGIAASIILGQIPDAAGSIVPMPIHTPEKIQAAFALLKHPNVYALLLAGLTFFVIRTCYKISVFIPGPLVAILAAVLLTHTWISPEATPLLMHKFGAIEGKIFQITWPDWHTPFGWPFCSAVISIVFIASLESLLSARMADRLAKDSTPFSPNRELLAQGLINSVVPLLNGFPCTGAFARTATNIKAGATSPAASIFQGIFILVLMFSFAPHIGSIPMACISGLLIYVAFNMVKIEEIHYVITHGRFHTFLMVYTALITFLTDLFIAVSSATALFYLVNFFTQKTAPTPHTDYAASQAKKQ